MESTSPFSRADHWLMIRLSHMGDVALTTGVLHYWGERYGTSFDVLTRSVWAPLFEGHPYVRSVHGVSEEIASFSSAIRYFWQLSRQYSGMGLLDLHGTLRSYTLSTLWGGPVLHYKKLRKERRRFLQKKDTLAGELLCSLSVPQRYALAAETVAPASVELKPRIFLSTQEQDWARHTLAALLGENIRPVVIHPFASAANKTWSPSHWHHLVRLCDNAGIPWICVGQGSDMFEGNKRSFVDKTSIRQTCALLEAGSVLVTGDSGPVHLASGVGTPVIALFGPTVKEWGFYPLGERDLIFEKSMPCRPCSLHGTKACSHNGECLQAIAPQDVFDAMQRLLME